MARVIMESGETIYTGGDKIQVFGTNSGQETVWIVAGNVTLDGSFARGGDTIRITGSSAGYDAEIAGQTLILSNGPITVTVPVGVVGTMVVFDDYSALLVARDGSIFFGDENLSADPAPGLSASSEGLAKDGFGEISLSDFDTDVFETASDRYGSGADETGPGAEQLFARDAQATTPGEVNALLYPASSADVDARFAILRHSEGSPTLPVLDPVESIDLVSSSTHFA